VDDAEERFRAFVAEVEPRLRRALVAAYGAERGRDAVAEALAFAWERWPEPETMTNPAGYLYRVGQSRTRGRKTPVVFTRGGAGAGSETVAPWIEPQLPVALREMSEHQRVAVVLIRGFEWTHREVAELLGISVSSVQTHLERGMARLRDRLGVNAGA
jgi:RNA polymerase sigma-70 factor (ECF subfamily)